MVLLAVRRSTFANNIIGLMTPPLPSPVQATPLPPLPFQRDPAMQAALDADHLKLLEIGFYVSGITTALRFIGFFFIAFFFGVMGFLATAGKLHRSGPSGNPPPALFFFIGAGIWGFILLLSLVFAGLEIYAGHCLKTRRHPILIQVVAAFYCISIPWGTALGVCTFMVLNRPSVRVLFS